MPSKLLIRVGGLATIAAFTLLSTAMPARAQGATLLSVDDPAYADLDRLATLGLLDTVIFGQRPYSRREVARIVRSACARAGAGGGDCTGSWNAPLASSDAPRILRGLARRFVATQNDAESPRRRVVLVDGAALGVTSTDAIRRGFPGNLTRQTEATIDPLATERLGRPAVRGQTTAFEIAQRVDVTSWLGFRAAERLELRRARDSSLRSVDGEVLQASVRARARNVAITVGREQVTWSQGNREGLFLASNAPALDLVSLANDYPFLLPGPFRRLGPTSATLVVADLGASVARSHSKLLTYKASIQPTRSLELGGTFMNHFGGEGGRASSLGNHLIDFVPFLDIFRRHNYYDTTRALDVDSDKLLGVDGRVRLAGLGGLLVTGEVLIDDFDVRRIPDLFGGTGSSMLALTVPMVVNADWSMKVWARHMGILTYAHGVVSNGITTRGRLLGEPLGPDAKEFAGELRWTRAPLLRMTLGARSAQYSDADYAASYADVEQVRYVVRKQRRGVNELRDGMSATIRLTRDDGSAFIAHAAAERIRNAGFTRARRRDYLVELSWRFSR